ncbi:MAG: RNA polymerase sigma-70 factor [Chitinophagaceae bacterium]
MPPDSTYGDERVLFHRLAQDDEQAYTEIFHLFTPRLFPYLLKIARDEHLARELLQETFVKLWEKRASLEQVEQPVAWLFRVAANLCLMHLRTQANRYRLLQQKGSAPEAVNEITAQLEGREVARVIQQAVHALPPQRQKIYRLSREDGLAHQQIADQLQISVQTVKNQLGISLKFIQEFLQKELDLVLIAAVLLQSV